MKNKTFLFLSVIVLLYSCENSSSKKYQNKIYLESEQIDFGNIKHSKKVNFKLNIINGTNKLDSVIAISKSCGCTQVKQNRIILPANSEKSLDLIYNPNKDSGKIKKTIILRTSNESMLIYRFKAFVKKKLKH